MNARKKYANENPNPAPRMNAPVIAITPHAAQKACQIIAASIPAPVAAAPKGRPHEWKVNDIVSWTLPNYGRDSGSMRCGRVVAVDVTPGHIEVLEFYAKSDEELNVGVSTIPASAVVAATERERFHVRQDEAIAVLLRDIVVEAWRPE